jgi:hypothetical protein
MQKNLLRWYCFSHAYAKEAQKHYAAKRNRMNATTTYGDRREKFGHPERHHGAIGSQQWRRGSNKLFQSRKHRRIRKIRRIRRYLGHQRKHRPFRRGRLSRFLPPATFLDNYGKPYDGKDSLRTYNRQRQKMMRILKIPAAPRWVLPAYSRKKPLRRFRRATWRVQPRRFRHRTRRRVPRTPLPPPLTRTRGAGLGRHHRH